MEHTPVLPAVLDPASQVSSSVKFLFQLSPSSLNGLQPTLDLPGFLVEVGQLLLELLFVQVVLPALFLDEDLDLMSQEPKPRIAVHAAFPVLQFARPDGSDDHLLRKSVLLPGRLIAQRGSLL
jgi:hypothetical protein